MAVLASCPICHEELRSDKSCEKNFESQLAFGKEKDFYANPNYRRYLTDVHYIYHCQGCGVQETGYHHDRCALEECPECHGVLAFCHYRVLKAMPEPEEPDWEV